MKLLKSEPGKLVFSFAGGSNINPKKDAFMHGLAISFVDNDHIVQKPGDITQKERCPLFYFGSIKLCLFIPGACHPWGREANMSKAVLPGFQEYLLSAFKLF